MNKLRSRVKKAARAISKTSHPFHAVYFGLVAVEAGKWYGAVAGVLFVITVVDAVLHASEASRHVD